MKSFKILLIVLAVTAVTSASNVFADSDYPIMTLDGIKVPAHNGSYTTPKKTVLGEYSGYSMQAIKNVTISPSGDELDVLARCYNGNNIALETPWRVLATGVNTMLTRDYNFTFTDGTYDLVIDSRWYYTDVTTIKKGKWVLTNNL